MLCKYINNAKIGITIQLVKAVIVISTAGKDTLKNAKDSRATIIMV